MAEFFLKGFAKPLKRFRFIIHVSSGVISIISHYEKSVKFYFL